MDCFRPDCQSDLDLSPPKSHRRYCKDLGSLPRSELDPTRLLGVIAAPVELQEVLEGQGRAACDGPGLEERTCRGRQDPSTYQEPPVRPVAWKDHPLISPALRGYTDTSKGRCWSLVRKPLQRRPLQLCPGLQCGLVRWIPGFAPTEQLCSWGSESEKLR